MVNEWHTIWKVLSLLSLLLLLLLPLLLSLLAFLLLPSILALLLLPSILILLLSSSINDIMDKPNFTLEELLQEDELLQEIKSKNDRLISL